MKNTIIILACIFAYTSLYSNTNSDSTFTESEITLKTSTGEIYGSLTIPNTTDQSPLVLIIAGSGPTDRNCNYIPNLHTNAYKKLAKALAINGISTLRFDKRGIGKSIPAMISENDLRFETYIKDVEDWISLLKTDDRFSEIILLGHSEGSLIGMIAAELKPVSAFISIAGVGKSADKILKEQLEGKLPPALEKESNRILDSLIIGKTVATFNPSLISIYRPSVQAYMISWFKYDPAKEISKLNIPILLIQGTTDIQVNENEVKLLAAAKPEAKLVIIEKMNHIMKESEADVITNMATYKKPDLPLIIGLVDEIVNFTKKI